MIVDERPRNRLEMPLRRWLGTLALSSCLTGLFLPDNKIWAIYTDDLIDYYYAFVVTEARAHRNVLKGTWAARTFRGWLCHDGRWRDDDLVCAAISTLPMGDGNAPEFAQAAHIGMGLRGGALRFPELLYHGGIPPAGPYCSGVIYDDHCALEQEGFVVSASGAREPHAEAAPDAIAPRRFEAMRAVYVQGGASG